MSPDYHRALEVATEAAQAAGRLLREEFHRARGPRGEPGKAPADTEAEWLIRRRLLEAFPHWRYRGEETGEHSGAPGETHCWLVDPNDGTASFQRGHRGSAVSIAVLRGGLPVLGVVYAFTAPDDAGDLFTWAEECGSLRRNAKPVEREAWRDTLGRYDVVLLSRGADHRPRVNAETVAPARFRAVPSIAYRLALVAAGEGVATVSLNSPGAWDYGAGHALLRAVGGALFDEGGQPVRYSLDGRSLTKFCFGGAPQVADELARRDWRRVLAAPREPTSEFDLVLPEPGCTVSDAALLARAQGCLLGQIVGDALGSAFEFTTARIETATLSPTGVHLVDGGYWDTIAGQPTDDSELALLLARTLVKTRRYDAEQTARAYRSWYDSNPFDRGMTICQALGAITPADIAAGKAAEAARSAANRESQANGSLMRISPLGIWGYAMLPEQLAASARADAELTHPHPACVDATAVYAVAIAHAIHSGADGRAVWEYARAWAKAHAIQPAVQAVLAEAEHQPPPDYRTWKAGWVLVALQNAFYQLLHASSFEAGLARTVREGGDTDTNAAIAGALLGAVYGRAAIPLSWRQMVLSCRPIDGFAGVRHPRPRAFWPVDALALAERLLRAYAAQQAGE